MRASLKLAAHFLERAKGNVKLEYWDVAFLLAYNSMLQASRAVLFKDGVKERSHECVALYLRERHGNAAYGKYIDVLDNYRSARHFLQYEGGLCTQESALQAVRDAEKYLELVKKELGKL